VDFSSPEFLVFFFLFFSYSRHCLSFLYSFFLLSSLLSYFFVLLYIFFLCSKAGPRRRPCWLQSGRITRKPDCPRKATRFPTSSDMRPVPSNAKTKAGPILRAAHIQIAHLKPRCIASVYAMWRMESLNLSYRFHCFHCPEESALMRHNSCVASLLICHGGAAAPNRNNSTRGHNRRLSHSSAASQRDHPLQRLERPVFRAQQDTLLNGQERNPVQRRSLMRTNPAPLPQRSRRGGINSKRLPPRVCSQLHPRPQRKVRTLATCREICPMVLPRVDQRHPS